MSTSPEKEPKKEKKVPLLFQDPNDGPYLGNIWGWKLSIIGAVVITVMVALMLYRYSQLDDASKNAPQEPIEFIKKPKQVEDAQKKAK